MNGSIASANNATLATVAANYGLKTVVDQHSLDIAARITPLEVDTNALLGVVTLQNPIHGEARFQCTWKGIHGAIRFTCHRVVVPCIDHSARKPHC